MKKSTIWYSLALVSGIAAYQSFSYAILAVSMSGRTYADVNGLRSHLYLGIILMVIFIVGAVFCVRKANALKNDKAHNGQPIE